MNHKEYEERMKNPNYKALQVTKAGDGKDYVFISYRGNSWETVLAKIVYRLQKEYGLRIYFDKDFASETNIWIEQFTVNMEDPHCKAFLCFFDEGYCTSYATLLELMHAMNKKAGLREKILSINFDVDWDKLSNASYDTGLGKEDPNNPGYKEEQEAFDKDFKFIMKERAYEDIEEFYTRGKQWKQNVPLLRANDCAEIMRILQPKNKRDFADTKEFYEQFIVGPLRKMTGDSVFESVAEPELPSQPEKNSELKTRQESKPQEERKEEMKAATDTENNEDTPKSSFGTIALNEFLKKYNSKTFKAATYSKIKLTGSEKAASYSTAFYDSTFEMVWAFVMDVLKERGVEYIRHMNQLDSKLANPMFITKEEHERRKAQKDSVTYRQLDVAGLENYSMYRHVDVYSWIATILKKHLNALELPLDKFVIEYQTGEGVSEALAVQEEEKKTELAQQEEDIKKESIEKQEQELEEQNKQESETKDGEQKVNTGGITGPVSITGEKPGAEVKALTGKISLPEFLKTYSNSSFQGASCKNIRLVGNGAYETYSVGPYETARNMVFQFAMDRIEEQGLDYIVVVNETNSGKNPIFITAEEHAARKARKESVSYKAVTASRGQGYSMCTHYSEYDWLRNSLVKQLKALGLSLDGFFLEFE